MDASGARLRGPLRPGWELTISVGEELKKLAALETRGF